MPETLREQLVRPFDRGTSACAAARRAADGARSGPGASLPRARRRDRGAECLVRGRLEAHGADFSEAKDFVARAGGLGMVLFARSQPDTPGKFVAHACSYEHMEMAAYELLAIVAQRADDDETVEVANSIREQEAAMAERLASGFDRAVEASLRDIPADDLGDPLGRYLSDAHAIESQSLQLLEQAPAIASEPNLKDHLEETRSQQAVVEFRLEARGERPSRFKNVVMRVGGLNLGGFFGAQPDTAAKLAGFAFAFEHLEIAAYEQLMRVARRAGDERAPARPSALPTRSAAPPRRYGPSSSQHWRPRCATKASAPRADARGHHPACASHPRADVDGSRLDD